MKTWIFQGNPTRFNVDDYLLKNENIWWSIRQEHLAKHIQLNDEVFIWRSDGGNKGSGGIVARTQVISLPQDYINDDESLDYWYEDVSEDTYLAVELKVFEVDVINGIKRLELKESENLADLKILHFNQNTNYLLSEEEGGYLRQFWYRRVTVKSDDIDTRFNDDIYVLPPLNSNGREREFKFYSNELKAQVMYEHLINNQTHRWMDANVLGRNGNTKGRESANILYYLGMRADYRGIFVGKKVDEVIQILDGKGTDYADVVRLLRLLEDIELDTSINSDLEAEQAEEGNGIEGNVKYYYGKRYERVSKNRKLAIKKHGLSCFACGFNFEKVYGERGIDFIEVHHIKPLSTLEEAVKINPETDLVPLCANCHRMVHRRKNDVLNVEQLKGILKCMKNES